MFVNGRWGSVCADEWDIEDANIFCKQLRFTDAELVCNHKVYQVFSYRVFHMTSTKRAGGATNELPSSLLCKQAASSIEVSWSIASFMH